MAFSTTPFAAWKYSQLTKKEWKISNPQFEGDRFCPMYRSWPWNGHRRFAYDLVRFKKPKRIVELGTYWGTSFFAFCQAVKDFKLTTESIAIDTWDGDDHTGKYDPEAFEIFSRIKNQLFSDINIHVLKMRFEEALSDIDDCSIDLLHIDGCHEYDAVKKDFESWLPKLMENGIVFFHDIADDVDYGSVRFWKEISSKFPSFSFQHSWGLGVLLPKGQKWLKQMEQNNIYDKIKIYEYLSELDLTNIKLRNIDNLSRKRDSLIKTQEKEIESLEIRLKDLEIELNRIRNSRRGKLAMRLGLIKLLREV